MGAPTLPFTSVGVTPAQDAVAAGLQVGWTVRDGWDVLLGYDALWSSNQTNQTGTVRVQVHF